MPEAEEGCPQPNAHIFRDAPILAKGSASYLIGAHPPGQTITASPTLDDETGGVKRRFASLVMPGLVPGIQPNTCSGARFALDPGNKCRGDTVLSFQPITGSPDPR
jgi:hypothetical protein